MGLSRDISKNYVRKVLEQRNMDEIKGVEDYNNSLITDFSSVNVVTAMQEEEIICAHEDNGLKRKLINYCFKHKEAIRKIPFIGEKAVQIKKNRLEESKKLPVLDMTPYLGMHFREFIGECYRIMLNREADPSGITTMADMSKNGASNECLVYFIASSSEFAGRYKVKNVKSYKKRYNKFMRGMYLKKLPVLGRIVKLFALSSQISLVYSDLDYRCTVLEGMVNGINDKSPLFNEKLSLLLERQIENNTNFVSGLETFSENMDKAMCENNTFVDKLKADISSLYSKVENDFHQSQDIVTSLHQKVDREAGIISGISVKLDELPQFIDAKNLQSRTSIASYSDGVVGVQCGDYFFGVPSEEWGLAYFLMINGHFECGSEKLFCSLLKPGMTVLDLGANLGIYTLHALKAGCEVYSFEPLPRIYEILGQNIKANGFADIGKAHLYNCAVSSKNGTAEFFYVKQMSGHSNMYGSEFDSDKSITVQVVSVDDCLKEIHHVDIVKIDVEGAEYDALHGMSRILSENPKIKILIEFAPGHIVRAGMAPQEVLDYYSELGFYRYLITEKGELRTVNDDELVNCFSENLLLTKEYIEL